MMKKIVIILGLLIFTLSILLINVSSNYHSLKEDYQNSIYYREHVLKQLQMVNEELIELRKVLKEKDIDLLYDQMILHQYKKNPEEILANKKKFNFFRLILLDHSNFATSIEKISINMITQMKYFLFDLTKIKSDSKEIEFSKWIPNISPVKNSKVSSHFGPRAHPISKNIRFHQGIDLSAPKDSIISATANGVVSYSGFKNGYGKTLIIDHDHGYQTLYAHASELFVAKGQYVSKEESIGLVGKTGDTTGYHVHYEVKVGDQLVDPYLLLDKL